MSGAIHPYPNTPSWRGAQLKSIGTTLPLPFTFTYFCEYVFGYMFLYEFSLCHCDFWDGVDNSLTMYVCVFAWVCVWICTCSTCM
jgi:hypothetical protein